MWSRKLKLLLPLLLVSLAAFGTPAQQQQFERFQGFGPPQRREPWRPQRPSGPPSYTGEFTFVRTIYTSPYSPYGRRYGGTWATDFPEADNHLITGLRDWAGTNLNIAPRPEQIEIMDDRLFDYPLIYFVEPGFMELSDEEAARLREYVARGGFMFFDDFWGVAEWENLERQMKKVLPDGEIKDLPRDHPLLHSYLDITETVQVPNIYNAQRGVTSEKGSIVPHHRGITDKRGRLVGFISFNSDLGDAWEWINDPRYPVKYGLAAYKVAINVIIYAMSH